eukprot:scaffold9560_cov98-Isochrysis_galbana.AAC.3
MNREDQGPRADQDRQDTVSQTRGEEEGTWEDTVSPEEEPAREQAENRQAQGQSVTQSVKQKECLIQASTHSHGQDETPRAQYCNSAAVVAGRLRLHRKKEGIAGKNEVERRSYGEGARGGR